MVFGSKMVVSDWHVKSDIYFLKFSGSNKLVFRKEERASQ